MRAIAVVLAAALAGSVTAQQCDPGYECKYHYQTKTHLWFYDFSTSCRAGEDFVFQVPGRGDNQRYRFQLCGTTAYSCPSKFGPGTAVQTYQPAGQGEQCDILGQGLPLYQPWTQSSPDLPPPGMNISFIGEPVDATAPDACPENTQSETRPGRTIMLSLKCNPAVAGILITAAEESPTCHYTLVGSTSWACAQRYRGPDASSSDTGNPDQYIGLDGGAAFGCVVGGAALAFIVWAGVGYTRTGRLPFIGAVGSRGATTGFASGASSSSTPAFGGSTTVGAGGGYGQVA